MYNLNSINPLDKIRLTNGIDELKNSFIKLIKTNNGEAVNLLNAENLHFPTLFLLKIEIDNLNIFDNLNLRNRTAIELTNQILEKNKKSSINKYVSSDLAQIAYSVLKWIFDTGFYDDGLSNEYDEVLDITAILLIKIYKDQTILPIIADMIFDRNRKGLFNHNLVWAFFESKDPNSLIMIANRLLSTEAKDVELASKLLSFIPGIEKNNNASKEKKYTSFLNWLEENNPFLYSTGQSLQQVNRPITYVIDLGAKYLNEYVASDTGKTLKSFTYKEAKLLNEFSKLDNDTKLLLANFSSMLYQKDRNQWNKWIHYPIKEQIRIAKSMMGGEQ
jgi:hypothetical protein